MTRNAYIFLFSLLLILVFIIGLRYGQRVEKANKAISFILSMPPTKPPTPQPTLAFLTYEHKGCKVRFLYPSSLEKVNESSTSAEFTAEGKKELTLNCNKSNPLFSLLADTTQTATESIVFRNVHLTAKIQNDMRIFSLQQSGDKPSLVFSIAQNLIPLLEKSLER